MKHIKYLVLLILLLVSNVSCSNTVTNVELEQSLLDYAASGDLAGVQKCIESGTDINVTGITGTPLMYASSGGHLEVVKYLVEKGADINSVDDSGSTALDLAKQSERSDIVEYLGAANTVK